MSKRQTFPSHEFEDEVRERGFTCAVLWEERGPKNTGIAWTTCYAIGQSIALVQTYTAGGWEVYTPFLKNDIAATVDDALRRCEAVKE